MPATPKPKRVLLVDDHPIVRGQIAHLLREALEVVEMLPEGTGLDAAVVRSAPEVIILDVTLPGVNGIELARRVTAAGCRIPIVFLTVHEDADFAREALAAGGWGYVVKSRLATDLLPAMHAALSGQRFISPCPELEKLSATQTFHHQPNTHSS